MIRNPRDRPIVLLNRPGTPPRESFGFGNPWQPLGSPMEDDYGVNCRDNGRDYWHARRAFLSSYQFSERNTNGDGFKEKVKRSVKGLNEMAMAVFLDLRREILSKRRVGIRVYRFSVGWSWRRPSNLFMVRCFVPWSYKDDQQFLEP